MKINFLVSEAFGALRSSFLRSFLTVIGIVVGIFSVTAMLALGEGLTANILDRFSSFAQGDLTVSGDINLQDFNWLRDQAYVKNQIATKRITADEVVAFSSDFSPSVSSVLGDYETITKYTLDSGTVFDFNDPTFMDHSAVVSTGFRDVVKEETGKDVLEQSIVINGQIYTVIGVIESTSGTFTRGDGVVLLPYGTVVGTLSDTKNFESVGVLLVDSSYYEVSGKHVLEGLNASRQLAPDSTDIFSVETSQSFIETAKTTTQMLTLFLGIVGGIALFVGGIGTMNMMLTTVTERTREIGLRKAIGARNSDILIQILIESVMLTTFGGAIGILLSLGGAKIANIIFADSEIIKVLVNYKVIALSAVISLLVGVVFGLYPARNASKLQPVDALRTE